MFKLSLPTSQREEFLEITGKIKALVRDSGVWDGLVVIFCPHTTCGLTINEQADPEVKSDILMALRRTVPDNLAFSHAEGNSPAHTKTSLVESSLTLIIENGQLQLGTWQGIFLCEFDGPRTRNILVKIIETKTD